jgi:hypothetical protein
MGSLGVLAHPERMRLFAAVALAGASGCEVAAAGKVASLDARDASRHCARLLAAGVLTSLPSGRVAVNLDSFRQAAERVQAPAGLPRSLFDEAGRLVAIPRDVKLRDTVLDWLADAFEPNRRYSEREVAAVIQERHHDHAAIRRYLVDSGRLERTDSGSVYWRAVSS